MRNCADTPVLKGDIDYMNAYRDFENDPVNYPYDEGKEFLSRLHTSHRHYVPIIDSAIYAPDMDNKSDKYPSFERGLEEQAFIMNADGSAYIGEVWPGLTGTYYRAIVLLNCFFVLGLWRGDDD